MKDVSAIRLENFQQLLSNKLKMKDIAKDCQVSYMYLSQLKSRAPMGKGKKPKQMGFEVARKIETGLGLPVNWMDQEHNSPTVVESKPEQITKQYSAQQIQLKLLAQAKVWIEQSKGLSQAVQVSPLELGMWLGKVEILLSPPIKENP